MGNSRVEDLLQCLAMEKLTHIYNEMERELFGKFLVSHESLEGETTTYWYYYFHNVYVSV